MSCSQNSVEVPRRLRRTEVTCEIFEPNENLVEDISTFPKSEAETTVIKQELNNIVVLRGLDPDVLNKIVDAMVPLIVEKGSTVLSQGESTADKLYIIETGVFQSTCLESHEKMETNKQYNNCGHFGDVSIFHYYPATCTVRAVTQGKVWMLDRLTYRRIVISTSYKRRRTYEALVNKIPLFSALPLNKKYDLVDSLTPLTFSDTDIIIKKGESALGMYFIESGSVMAFFPDDQVLNAGDFFNDHILTSSDPLNISDVFAVGATKLAFLDLCTFQRLFDLSLCK